jgi:hypothetical protein
VLDTKESVCCFVNYKFAKDKSQNMVMSRRTNIILSLMCSNQSRLDKKRRGRQDIWQEKTYLICSHQSTPVDQFWTRCGRMRLLLWMHLWFESYCVSKTLTGWGTEFVNFFRTGIMKYLRKCNSWTELCLGEFYSLTWLKLKAVDDLLELVQDWAMKDSTNYKVQEACLLLCD